MDYLPLGELKQKGGISPALSMEDLTLTIPACVTLSTTFFIDHGRFTAIRT